MLIEVRPKSVGVAYVLWLVLGAFAAHRFYTRRFASAAAMICLYWFGLAVTLVGGIQAAASAGSNGLTAKAGVIMLGVSGFWWLVDAFLIPGWISSFGESTKPASQGLAELDEEFPDYQAADDIIARYKAKQSAEAAKEAAKPVQTFLKPLNARAPTAQAPRASFGRR